MWKAAAPTLAELGIDITNHTYQKLEPSIVNQAAVIIAMDQHVHADAGNALLKQFPATKNKLHIFSELTQGGTDIADPIGNDDTETHRALIHNICSTIENNLETILSWT